MVSFIDVPDEHSAELTDSAISLLNYIIDNRHELRKDSAKNNTTIIYKFMSAFSISPEVALNGLCYIRDCHHGGLGERRIFRVCLDELASTYPDQVMMLLPHIPDFGRWDDMFGLIYNPTFTDAVVALVSDQLIDDYITLNERPDQPVSQLAKWLPSINTSSKKSRDLAKLFCRKLWLSQFTYRKMLKRLRSHLAVVEQSMSLNDWKNVDYKSMPVGAKAKYQNRFNKSIGPAAIKETTLTEYIKSNRYGLKGNTEL